MIFPNTQIRSWTTWILWISLKFFHVRKWKNGQALSSQYAKYYWAITTTLLQQEQKNYVKNIVTFHDYWANRNTRKKYKTTESISIATGEFRGAAFYGGSFTALMAILLHQYPLQKYRNDIIINESNADLTPRQDEDRKWAYYFVCTFSCFYFITWIKSCLNLIVKAIHVIITCVWSFLKT